MKKWKIGLVGAILVTALVGTTAASAAGHGGHHRWYAVQGEAAPPAACPWTDSCWRDTDGDGVWGTWNGSCVDAGGDGLCDVCGRAVCGYADTDGDGICDHYGTWHTGGGHHGGHGSCRW